MGIVTLNCKLYLFLTSFKSGSCLSCNTTWHKGSPQEIEVHLAYECQKVDPSTRDLFLQRLAAKSFDQNLNELNTPNKKRKRNEICGRNRRVTLSRAEKTKIT